jgi:cell division septation protein DedD
MEPALKQRLVGALVISALAIVFLPRFIVGHDKDSPAADVSLQLPGAPDRNFETRELPLTSPGATPPGGVVGMNASAPPLPPGPAPAPTDANGNPLPANPDAPATPPVASPGADASSPSSATVAPAATAAPTPPPATTPAAATATTAPAPATAIPAAQSGGGYVVNAGIYSNNANAQSLMNSLKAAKLPAYIETVTLNGKTGTRVRIGPFAQRGDAEAARLRAQQVRSDMNASVTALDAATEAPAPKPALVAPPAKPAIAPATSRPGAAPAVAPVSVPPASTKPAAPAAISPAAAGRGYAVQVSAFRAEADALALRNRLRAAGFTAFSERVQADSGTLYRVRVGPTADRDAADKLLASLSQKLGLNGMVVAYP